MLIKRPCSVSAVIALLFICANGDAAQQILLGPQGSQQFGDKVISLPNGNFVVTDPMFDLQIGTQNVGAVYLFRPDGQLISKLTGTQANDQVGVGDVTVLSNGNFLVSSYNWNHGASPLAGAVTWINGETGLNGVVGPTNSLVGESSNDVVGSHSVVKLQNGNYLVRVPTWDNGSVPDAGAVAWGSKTAGVVGAISNQNALIGTQPNEELGLPIPLTLTNGNYVVSSSEWNNGIVTAVGAVAWGNGNTGLVGTIGAHNSMIGRSANDRVRGLIALKNGNYVIGSNAWDSSSAQDVGLISLQFGNTPSIGTVDGNQSITGAFENDNLGYSYLSAPILALENGNFVVSSVNARPGGAVTWVNGSVQSQFQISPSNSLFGGDHCCIASSPFVELSNGNFLIVSPSWRNSPTDSVGAVTWGSKNGGLLGFVGSHNSIIGSTDGDMANGDPEFFGITALKNGNYVIHSATWNVNGKQSAGAAIWGNGNSGTSGNDINTLKAIVGANSFDRVALFGVSPLSDGNYYANNNFFESERGAATWGDGASGTSVIVGSNNSFLGSMPGDWTGAESTGLSNGKVVIHSSNYGAGGTQSAGAISLFNGETPAIGVWSTLTALIGKQQDNLVCDGIIDQQNNRFIARSPVWKNEAGHAVGAITSISSNNALPSQLTSSNSLVGSHANDRLGENFVKGGRLKQGVSLLPDNNYVIQSIKWDNNNFVDSGAVTFGRNDGQTVGEIGENNSVIGQAEQAGLKMNWSYDVFRKQLIVGSPDDNRVTLFRPGFATFSTINSNSPSNDFVPVLFTVQVQSVNGIADGEVRVVSSSGEKCSPFLQPIVVDANTIEMTCMMIFATGGDREIFAEHYGSIDYAYSRSISVIHSVNAINGIFSSGFE